MAPALSLGGTGTTLALRPYQQEAVEAVLEATRQGCRRQLGVAGVGAGKTVVLVSLAARMNVRTLIIAHRDELIQQAAEKVRLWWPDADLGIVKAERNDFGAQDVIVASIQSLSPARLARMGRFGLVVVDETHRIAAPSYVRALDALDAGKPDGPLLLGVTATPDRADGKGLDSHFDKIVFNYDLLWLIREGYLVDIRAIGVEMKNLRLENVKVRHGDYADGELGAAMTAANAPWWIVKSWREHAAGMKTLVFMPTVENAEDVAAEFNANGIRSACVSGKTPMDERRRILRDFSSGRIQVLSNVGVATEGYDEPSIECVVLGRPTKSRGLFTQMAGRGVRLHPGKSELLLLDVTSTSENLDLCSVATLAGVSKKAMKGRSLVQAVEDKEAAEAAAAAKLAARVASASLRPDADMVSRRVELFKGGQPDRAKRLTWRKRRGVFSAEAGGMTLVMEPMGGDRYRVLSVVDKVSSVVMEGVPLALAQGVAEEHARSSNGAVAGKPQVHNPKGAPTDKQMAFAQKLGLSIPPGMTKGELSRRIDAELSARKARR
jgi:ATP-dependent helicase IRC3